MRPKRKPHPHQCARQIIDRVERSEGDAQVVMIERAVPLILDHPRTAGRARELGPRVENVELETAKAQPVRVRGAGAAHQKRSAEIAPEQGKALFDILEGAVEQEQLGAMAKRPVPAHRAQIVVEDRGHPGRLCDAAACATSGDVRVGVQRAIKVALDFALPPRCGCCGDIVEEVDTFCVACWAALEFLGDSGCGSCGRPLEATEEQTCAPCLAQPPIIDRTRAAVAYDERSRVLALRLKYARRVALAKTMARFIAPLAPKEEPKALLLPVPLHRTRLWQRGFNQAALIAQALATATGIPSEPALLKRTKRTRPLRGMSFSQRRRTVRGAFGLSDRSKVEGRTVILVDDVLTTGSTAEACARALKRAGAARVELLCWARVIRPTHLA